MLYGDVIYTHEAFLFTGHYSSGECERRGNRYDSADYHADEYGYDERHDAHVPYVRMLEKSDIVCMDKE